MAVIDILNYFVAQLQATCIDPFPDSDPSKAGVVKLGPLQGEPEPDVARISIEVHQNDPDDLERWLDEVVEVEIPNAAIWSRKFTIKYQLLLDSTSEALIPALTLGSIIKERIERTIFKAKYAGVPDVVRGAIATKSVSQLIHGGGPPDIYNITGRFQFDVLTEEFQT